MSVKVSPISRFVSLLIIVIGIFILLVGWATGILQDSIAGIAFIILGIVLYRLLYRFDRKVQQPMRDSLRVGNLILLDLDIPIRHSKTIVEASPRPGQQMVLDIALDG
jgi:hypothetical protein